MSSSQTTTDHDEIRRWAEKRGGRPARVGGTGEGGVLRIHFGDGEDDALEDIAWEEFFEVFEESQLAMVYQEETKDGGESRFNKLVSRD